MPDDETRTMELPGGAKLYRVTPASRGRRLRGGLLITEAGPHGGFMGQAPEGTEVVAGGMPPFYVRSMGSVVACRPTGPSRRTLA
jgi:hypothetical protein